MLGHLTYLVFELVWGLPVLALQWGFGRRMLLRDIRVLSVAVLLSTAYLCLADGVAISAGIWAIHSSRVVGVRLGDLPVEETLFFLLTNAMVAQTIIIVSAIWNGRS
jgi:lycopene cyclase domain-containing protein